MGLYILRYSHIQTLIKMQVTIMYFCYRKLFLVNIISFGKHRYNVVSLCYLRLQYKLDELDVCRQLMQKEENHNY